MSISRLVIATVISLGVAAPAAAGVPNGAGLEVATVPCAGGESTVCTFSFGFPVEDGSIAVDVTIIGVAVPPG